MAGDWPPRPLPVPPVDLSDRFTLRPWRPADAAALAAAWADSEVKRWLEPPESTQDAAERWIAGEAVRRQSAAALDLVIDVNGAVAGEVGFSSFDRGRRACLVGYWLSPDHRARGIASEAVAAAVAWLRAEVGASAVLAQCDPHNVASHRVAERAGFELLAPDHAGLRVYLARR